MQSEVLHSNDSKSLWNYTLSPGWTQREVEVFQLALMKFGLGKWSDIVKSKCLPGKTMAQLNNQMQRMIGQQSTSEFTGLHIDPSDVFKENAKKEGRRKNGCLINMENNPKREEIAEKRAKNKEKYGLTQEEIDKIIIPVLSQEEMSSVVVKSTTEHKATARQAKFDQIRVLQQQLETLTARLEGREPIPLEEESKSDEKPTTKQAASKRKKNSTTKKSKKIKNREETDLEMAMRLQEEEGMDFDMEVDDDDDFESRPRRRNRRKPRYRY